MGDEEAVVSTGTPRRVDASRIAATPDVKIPTTIVNGIALATQAAFALPAMIGYGEHWQLADEEAKRLAQAIEAVLKTASPNTKKALFKHLDKWLPWVSLAVTAGTIVYPRVLLTQATTAMGVQSDRQRTGGRTKEHTEGVASSSSAIGNGIPLHIDASDGRSVH